MKAFGLATMGGDMELRYLPDGTPVGQASLAFRLGKKDKDGKYLTQWVNASLFGKRAESLAPYLLKGSKHAFVLRDIRIDEFVGKDGDKRVSLKADIDDVELGGKNEGSTREQPHNNPMQNDPHRGANSASPGGGNGNGFDDMPDDIPF